jgi:hypothetical protein
MDPEALRVTWLVAGALERLGVAFHLGGSLASSIHGFPRATLDADLVADLRPGQGEALAKVLGADFYADARAMEVAIASRSSFNLIHLETMFKVDVFVTGPSPFDRESFERSRPEAIGPGGRTIRVATPEDVVLHKLRWFREGGAVSERQWTDAVGVLEVQKDRLDRAYLDRWARELGVADLLDRALAEGRG